MQLEFDEAAGVLMLWDISPASVEKLQAVLRQLMAAVPGDERRLDALPTVEANAGCSLVASVGTIDAGLERVRAADFRRTFTPNGWGHVVCLLEPFVSDPKPNAFQYLAEGPELEWIIGAKFGW